MDETPYYVGISGSKLPVEAFDLGHGASLHRTYAHLTAPYLVAFARAEPGKAHPAPWRAADGGFAFDIEIELRVAPSSSADGMSLEDRAAWILAVLRVGYAPYLSAPVTIDMPFNAAARSAREPRITPLEIAPRNFYKPEDMAEDLPDAALQWLREAWPQAAALARSHPSFRTALLACDGCRVRTRVAQSVLMIWGALEQLFAPAKGELRYRVAANIAAYLEPRGPGRLATYKQVLKLYDDRSTAAHTSKDVDRGTMLASWVLLRNALVKMIHEDKVPTQSDFEHLIMVDTNLPDEAALSWGARKADAPADTDAAN
jgi:hypothetical protein